MVVTKSALSRSEVHLVHRPTDTPPWQWHAKRGWVDPISREEETYLGGDLTEGEARMYGRRNGWCG